MAGEYKEKLGSLVRQATSSYLNTSKRAEKDRLYSTLEDFTRADPNKKRLVVIGCTGSGKSTLLNVLSGWRFVQSKDTDYQFAWKKKEAKGEGEGEMDPIFLSGQSDDSVTKCASFANVDFRGDAEREFIVMDTPGHDDPAGNELGSQEARDALGAIAADLHNKLKALGHVHAILVLHNDVVSNRLNPATYQILKMVDEKFANAGGNVWKHVLVGYSKCNGHDLTWRANITKKKAQLQEAIRTKIPGCGVDVPMLALGGGELEPKPPSVDDDAEADDMETLWEFLSTKEPLDTSRLMPFEGADVKWQKMIDAKDEAEARAKAALIYLNVLLKMGTLMVVLFWRQMMLPAWLSMLLLNLPGVYDEIAIGAAVVYWVGPQDVFYSLQHFYNTWAEPRLRPYIESYLGPVVKAKAE